VLTFHDEFDGTQLNKSIWGVRVNQSHCCGPLGGSGELQLYLPDEVSLADGALHLRTRRREAVDPDGKQWNFTSGWVDSKGKWSQRFGRFEANCSLPARSATGIWPAFWLMPDSAQCWPTGGEIDVFEFNGNWLEDQIFGSYHWANAGECGKDHEPIPGRGYRPLHAHSDWQRGWHVYAVEWWPDRLDFFVDNVKYLTRTAEEVHLPTSPMYVILNQAVDSWLFPPSTGPGQYGDGVHLSIDYVRAYSPAHQRPLS
jgi:beta-glucanase (GH16 family)